MILESDQLPRTKEPFILFSQKAIFIFSLKILLTQTTCSPPVTLTYLSSKSRARRGGRSRCSNTKHYSTTHKFNLTCWSANAGENNWAKSAHFEAAATKIRAERGGRELPSNKNAPELCGWSLCRATSRGCTRWVVLGGLGGGRLKALNLPFLSQLAFSSDPEWEERGPCLIRRDDNLHPSQ